MPTRRVLGVVIAAVTAAMLFFVSALPAWAADSMMLTFVRHGESEANAAGVIDTSVPGPHLTELGRQQAEAVADELAGNNYDGVYASSMIRTQETAAPLADRLGQSIVVLPGLREIDAGVFEGQSEDEGLGRIGYVLAPVAWTLGARFVPVLGADDGNAFDARVDDAIETIYDSGDRNAVAFSHGATIMFWTLMNVDNPDLGLLLSHPLPNTGVVVITGNPEDGWTLVDWDGVQVAAVPSLATKLFVNVRNVVTAPQTAAYRIGQAFATGDITTIATAIRDGIVDITTKVIEFVPRVVRDVVDSLDGSTPVQSDQPASPSPETVSALTVRETKSAEKPEPEKAVTATEKSNGATDLTDGNKVEPGERTTTSTVDDQSDEVVTEINEVTDETSTDPSGDDSDNTDDTDDTDAAEAADDTGSEEPAAA
jgi:broad specificity phosphatase PhoE